jgi:hypothetical protein
MANRCSRVTTAANIDPTMGTFAVLLVLLIAAGAVGYVLASLPGERDSAGREARMRAEHWRALAGAAHEVQRTADGYARTIGERRDPRAAVRDYQSACRWLLLVVASGPTPPPLRPLIGVLTDARNPEAVAATRAGDELLAGLAELQDAADDARRPPPAGPSEWRAFLRLACLTVRARFRTS